MTSRYAETYARWKADPEGFWAEAGRAIDWFTPVRKTFDPDDGPYGRWFVGATTNTCHNCVDRHVEAGLGEARFTPEVVAPACHVPVDTIRRLARELAAAESAVVYGRIRAQTGVPMVWLFPYHMQSQALYYTLGSAPFAARYALMKFA